MIWVNSFAFRPSSRRKPSPVVNTGEAQMKFGDMKAISSDMFFGKEDNSEVTKLPTLNVCCFLNFDIYRFLSYELLSLVWSQNQTGPILWKQRHKFSRPLWWSQKTSWWDTFPFFKLKISFFFPSHSLLFKRTYLLPVFITVFFPPWCIQQAHTVSPTCCPLRRTCPSSNWECAQSPGSSLSWPVASLTQFRWSILCKDRSKYWVWV